MLIVLVATSGVPTSLTSCHRTVEKSRFDIASFFLQHAKFKINLVALWTKDGDFELLKEELLTQVSANKKSPKGKKSKPAEDEDLDEDDDEDEEEMSE